MSRVDDALAEVDWREVLCQVIVDPYYGEGRGENITGLRLPPFNRAERRRKASQ